MLENMEKPILKFVSSTKDTIKLLWITNLNDTEVDENISYKVQIKDPIYRWIEKYWGTSKEATIKNLSAQTVYEIRVGVVRDFVEELWSDTITAATKLAPKWTYHLFQAIKSENTNQLQAFLSERNNVLEAVNSCGETALMQAVRQGNFTAASILLKTGSNPNCKIFPSLQTPLMLSCFSGYTKIVNILDKHGANWLLKDICGRNALHYAVSNSQLETLQMAIKGGCDVNLRDIYNWTPLMRAAILGASDDVLSVLLEHGANLELRDEYEQTCIDMARLYKNENFLMLITKRDEQEVEEDFRENEDQT